MLQATSQVSKPPSAGADKSTGQAPRIDFTSAGTTQKPEKNLVEKIRNFRVEFGPSRKDILHFTNQLAVMIRAGISLQDALEVIGQQCQNRKRWR